MIKETYKVDDVQVSVVFNNKDNCNMYELHLMDVYLAAEGRYLNLAQACAKAESLANSIATKLKEEKKQAEAKTVEPKVSKKKQTKSK